MKDQFNELHPLLREMAREFESLSLSFGIDPIVTRVSDAVPGESGVHPAKRAIDFRDEVRSADGQSKHFLYNPEQIEMLLERLNLTYPRPDHRSTLIHHSFRGAPFHFHLQILADTSLYPVVKPYLASYTILDDDPNSETT